MLLLGIRFLKPRFLKDQKLGKVGVPSETIYSMG